MVKEQHSGRLRSQECFASAACGDKSEARPNYTVSEDTGEKVLALPGSIPAL